MAVHRYVRDDSVATSMRINNAETVQERACILMCFQPVRQCCIIQALLVLPRFDGDAIDFPVPLIVITGHMLGGEIKYASDTWL